MYHMQLCFACLVPSHYHILVLYFAVCVSEFSTCNTSGFFPVACGCQQPLARCRKAWSSVCPKCNKKDFHGPSSTFTDCSSCTIGHRNGQGEYGPGEPMWKMEQPLQVYDHRFHKQCCSGCELPVLTIWKSFGKKTLLMVVHPDTLGSSEMSPQRWQ